MLGLRWEYDQASESQVKYIEKLAKMRTLDQSEFVQKLREEIKQTGLKNLMKGRASYLIEQLQAVQKDLAQAKRMGAPATEAQLKFLRALYEERKDIDDVWVISAGMALNDEVYQKKGFISGCIDQLLKVQVQRVVEGEQAQEVAGAEIRQGTYTVVLNGGEDYVTLRVEEAKFVKDAKKMMISYLSGADNENSYTGFAFVNANGIAVWNKFKSNERLVKAAQVLWALAQTEAGLGEAHEEFLKNAEAYALESGHCMRCLKKLTVPASLHRGLGPVCAGLEMF